MKFDRYIGIDYSGAESPESRIKGLQVYVAEQNAEPTAIRPQLPARNWSRKEVAHWLLAELQKGEPLLIGIDHGFSFPMSYFQRYKLNSWPAFLDDFCRYWPTDQPYCYVDFIRDGMWWRKHEGPRGTRTGSADEFRLCENWTSSAKNVFQFDMQGSVAKSTHSGIPWLRFLRNEMGEKLFFWPFDRWHPPEGVSVIAEVYSLPFPFPQALPEKRPNGRRAGRLFGCALARGKRAARDSGPLFRSAPHPSRAPRRFARRLDTGRVLEPF